MFEIKMLSALSHILSIGGCPLGLSLLIHQFIAVILRYFLTPLY